MCLGFSHQVLVAFAGFTTLKCGLLGAQEPRELVVTGNVIGPVPGASPATLLTQGFFQAPHCAAATGDRDIGDFFGPRLK